MQQLKNSYNSYISSSFSDLSDSACHRIIQAEGDNIDEIVKTVFVKPLQIRKYNFPCKNVLLIYLNKVGSKTLNKDKDSI